MSGPEAVARVAGGAIRGRTAPSGVRVFLGIPYAAAPVGAIRFQPPQPVAPWNGIRPAQSFGPTVPKSRMAPHFEQMWPERWIGGDDSLNLNVWAPPEDAEPAPVLVWLHGGGFTNGSGSSRELDGSAFASGGIVCVTLNYRVAADGFLALGDGIANVGLLDQIAALTWVRENIGAFGGDPNRVTLAGHSAGGSSVACLLTARGASGLFARAIVQSTSGIARLSSPAFSQRVGHDLAARLGIAPERAAFADVPTARLLDAVDEQRDELPGWGGDALTMAPWAPHRDGDVLPDDPLGEVSAGRAADVPLLTGTTRDELRLYLTPEHIATVTEEQLREHATAVGLGPRELEQYRSTWRRASPGDLLAAIDTDRVFRAPIVGLAEARLEGGAKDTWVYRLDRPDYSENAGYGAAHGVDVPFVFASTEVGETHARLGPHPSPAVSACVHGVWSSFIRGEDPPWDRYDLVNATTGVLTDSVIPVTHLDRRSGIHLISQHRDSDAPSIQEA